MELNFLSLNVNGLNDGRKRAEILNYLKLNKAQIVFLQETHIKAEDKNRFQYPGFEILAQSNFKEKRRGTIILWKKSAIMPKILYKIEKQDGSLSLVNSEYENRLWTLINIYWFPVFGVSSGKKQINSITDRLKGKIILAGDFNCVLDRTETTKEGNFKLSSIAKILKKWIDELSLIDTYNHKDLASLEYTHYSYVHGTQTRIDKMFISEDLKSLLSYSSITPCPFSDHNAVILKISVNFRPLSSISRIPAYLIKLPEFSD